MVFTGADEVQCTPAVTTVIMQLPSREGPSDIIAGLIVKEIIVLQSIKGKKRLCSFPIVAITDIENLVA